MYLIYALYLISNVYAVLKYTFNCKTNVCMNLGIRLALFPRSLPTAVGEAALRER